MHIEKKIQSPFTGGKATLRTEVVEENFRKESFPIHRHYYQCDDTGETFSTTEADELNVRQVFNQYREKHHIPFPEEIIEIREQYGISATKMSEVLGFGINNYRLYEQGGSNIPSFSNAKLIRLAKNPMTFRIFVQEKKEIFSATGYEKLIDQITRLEKKKLAPAIISYIWNHHMEANAFTGFVKPNFEKVAHFVIFFAENNQPQKTRLNKLLFYSDFLNFKRTGHAISGCNYRAIQMGPVPSHFRELFGILESEGYIRIEDELSEHGNVGERFWGEIPFDPSLFTEEERATMEQVAKAFNETRTRQLIEISHAERAWLENIEQKELIDYQKYAFDLKAV